MASRRSSSRPAQLWQVPLLLISLGLFGYSAYLLIDPKPGPTISQKIDLARAYLDQHRPEAALGQLNKLLHTEKLLPEEQAVVRLMLAESLEMGQQQRNQSVPRNHEQIVHQIRLALELGAILDAEAYRRLGDSYAALDRYEQALSSYRQAIAISKDHAMSLTRRVIDLQLAHGDSVGASASLEEYLRNPALTDAERAWALGRQSQLLSDAGRFAEARQLLEEALRLSDDPVVQGEVHHRLGYAWYKLGDVEQSERHLRLAREMMGVRHPLDAETCYLLGRICLERNDPEQAASFFQIVLVSHVDSSIAPLARMGRGLSRIMMRQDDAGLTDLRDLVIEVQARASRVRLKSAVIEGLQQAAQLLAMRGNHQGELELLANEQALHEQVPPGFFARLAEAYERRADQIERTIPGASQAEKIRRAQQVRELRTQAGSAQIALSQRLTLVDDKGYGQALWKGIELFDRAGHVHGVIAALELFVVERPDDALAPDALLRLGRAYQAAGMFDKAIAAYQRNQFRYPNSLAASKSAVPLAQAFIAQGPQSHARAEAVLLSVVDNNPLLTPESEEYRQAILELAQLYYRTNRFEEAVARLEEFTARYPDDDRMVQLLFLMADSYRKSAGLLEEKLKQGTGASADASSAVLGAAALSEAAAARRERLTRARALFDRVVQLGRDQPPSRQVDQLYLKLAHFYRADCLYDLGDYVEAIRLYDAAALKYQDDPSSLAAYVQIVNAYCALGKVDEARTANERAKWLLRRIPREAFDEGSFAMPKAYWEQWLKWTSEAGMW